MSEYRLNPLASDSEDERKIYKAEVRAERKARKDQQKLLPLKRSSFRGIGLDVRLQAVLNDAGVDEPMDLCGRISAYMLHHGKEVLFCISKVELFLYST